MLCVIKVAFIAKAWAAIIITPDKHFTNIKTKFSGQAHRLAAVMTKNLGCLHGMLLVWILDRYTVYLHPDLAKSAEITSSYGNKRDDGYWDYAAPYSSAYIRKRRDRRMVANTPKNRAKKMHAPRIANFTPLHRRVVQQAIGCLGLRPAPTRHGNAPRRSRRQVCHQPVQPPRPPRIPQLHIPSSRVTQLITTSHIIPYPW